MKVTLDLPGSLVRELKFQALHEGRKLKDLAAELFQTGLAQKTAAQATKGVHQRVKLPLFECSSAAPAKRMKVQEVLKLEQEILHAEDLRRAGFPV